MHSKLPANFRLDVDMPARSLRKLLEAYRTTGIFGNKEMPEDMLPEGVTPGSEEHLRFITLTVAMGFERVDCGRGDSASHRCRGIVPGVLVIGQY